MCGRLDFRPLTRVWSSLLREFPNVRYINPLCEVCAGARSNGTIWRRTSARCMSISRTSLLFSGTSIAFSALAQFDSLKLPETNCYLCGYSLHLFFWSLISYFLRNEAKCFTLKAPLKPVGVVVHVVFFSWNNNNSPLQKREGTGASFLYWLDWKSKH